MLNTDLHTGWNDDPDQQTVTLRFVEPRNATLTVPYWDTTAKEEAETFQQREGGLLYTLFVNLETGRKWIENCDDFFFSSRDNKPNEGYVVILPDMIEMLLAMEEGEGDEAGFPGMNYFLRLDDEMVASIMSRIEIVEQIITSYTITIQLTPEFCNREKYGIHWLVRNLPSRFEKAYATPANNTITFISYTPVTESEVRERIATILHEKLPPLPPHL